MGAQVREQSLSVGVTICNINWQLKIWWIFSNITSTSFWSSDSLTNSHCFQKLVDPPLLLDPLRPLPLAAFLFLSPADTLSVSILESGSPSSPLGWFFSCCFRSLQLNGFVLSTGETGGSQLKSDRYYLFVWLKSYFILASRAALCVRCWCFSVLTLSTCDSILLIIVSQLSHQPDNTEMMEPISLFLHKVNNS